MRTPLTRRDFLHTGVVAAGGVLVGRSLAAGTVPLAASVFPPPADPVRFAIIGVGMQGSGLLRAALDLGHECVAAADLYDGRHALAREITGNPALPVTRRHQDVLARRDVDCVIVAVPDHQHRQVVVDALGAGKDVYVEKPMSHTVADGAAIVAAAEQTGRIVQVGSQRVSSALIAKAAELYRAGVIGDVSMVELSLGRNSPTGAWQYPPPTDLSAQTLDWNAWLGSAPRIPLNPLHFARWRCWREYGTGVAGDLMVHLLSGMLRTLGWNEVPRSAQSLGGIVRWKDGRNMPDLHAVLFDYHGVPVYVRLGLGTDTPETARFMGPNGVLEANGQTLHHVPQVGADAWPSYYAYSFPREMREAYFTQWHAEHDPQPGREPVGDSTTYHGPDWDDLAPHLWNFFEAVRTRAPVVEDAVFGNHAAIACHMANESYFRGTAVRWDPATGTVQS